ncbi:hypothetical protein ACIQPR_10440 [Streptomyces sp. NPDC091280]|uniref:hypothetical protein n=1 Tax=Streptomyces sp. NPDC091280 TaxID=3365984 RepID=UPI00382F64D5
MRMMLKACMDTEKGNEAIRNGTLGKLMEESLEQIKPEAAYFTAEGGKRTAFLFFDLKDASDIPSISEPFFLNLGAELTWAPVMNAEDVASGLAKIR